jgi:hypothetical protein
MAATARKCPYCGQKISASATTCKHCGADLGAVPETLNKAAPRRARWIPILLALIAIAGIALAVIYVMGR